MPPTLEIVLPVFGLIGLGYIAARLRVCPEAGFDGIMTFVATLAAPCLLMRAVLDSTFAEAFNPPLLASFYLPVATLYFVGIAASRLLWKRTPGEAVSIAFGANFGNTVMLGVPVVITAFGEAANSHLIAVVGLHAVCMYLLGVTMMEGTGGEGAGFVAGLRRTAVSVSTNPLLIGVALGAAGNLAGIAPLPSVMETPTRMLAQAAVPLGLFGVGAALARYRVRGALEIATAAAFSKLIMQPALTYALATWVFQLEPLPAAVATIVAAMPMGMNSYVFASMYHRAEDVAASGIVLTTVAAMATIPLWLLLFT